MSPFKVFLFFSRREKAGICTLLVLILLTLGSRQIYLSLAGKEEMSLLLSDSLHKAFEAAMAEADSLHTARQRRSYAPPYPRSVSEAQLFSFDPNEADSATLRRLGLPWWVARHVVRYRQRGGSFRYADDFEKIYGLDQADFQRLRPYIALPPRPAPTAARPPQLWMPDTVRADSLPPRPPKLAPGTLTELNSADTTRLQMIPGIGSAIARRIIAYREQLGGFYRLEQLAEINLDHTQLRSWLSIDERLIRRINLNRAGIERLRRHPYLNFYQARTLVEYRRTEGEIKSLKPFALSEDFTTADFERISHYVCFDEATPPAPQDN